MENIVTPIDPDGFEELLKQTGYDDNKTKYIINGFKFGFSLEYEGGLKGCKRLSPNLKLRVGNKTKLWNKVMKEVQLGR